jgi:hypothetical protein
MFRGLRPPNAIKKERRQVDTRAQSEVPGWKVRYRVFAVREDEGWPDLHIPAARSFATGETRQTARASRLARRSTSAHGAGAEPNEVEGWICSDLGEFVDRKCYDDGL